MSKMKHAVSYFIKKAADWLFRKRSPALLVFRSGVCLILATVVGGWTVSVVYSDVGQFLELNYQSSNTTQLFLSLGFFLGVTATIFGVVWEYQIFRDERKRNEKKKTIVLEQRGLVDTSDTPLYEFVKNKCSWQVDSIVNDIRERIIDNVITRPDLALVKLSHIKTSISEKTAQYAASDISIAYGGIFPIPFSFYAGYLLDDESQITRFDWDRDLSSWRELDEGDDGEEFVIERPERTAKTVVLAVSISYPVDRLAISTVFPDQPIHYLSLPSLDRNNHWAKGKQDRLSGDFFEYCKSLLGLGVENIHLILASQNSIAFRLGQTYDKRNLPNISVYQYERHQSIKYPWCLRIPHKVGVTPIIVDTEFKHVA
ncbi:SAVED domain-containing protein [Marinomonas transparens]|uniref:SAVED domain-containing protein n=1 Tax=Marinomonas transparens TaxID=2795388 RepID=A0A934N4B9_9GAMM|nr:SAVED domain-containing protein [Marinomonas transparens]MBJ7539918.1 SAVED domain-containing protein [Marinomonas transparens]